ncbi:MAG: OmpH family outer membrane protein [Planctomycetaceae bacterium]|nr:OmpH family outer membrane protein [Planctomycetaceae bacterium]
MKKLIVGAMAVAMLASLLVVSGKIQGQTQPQRPAATGDVPHKVGLIDMAEVFKDYQKFKGLRDELQAEIEHSDNKARAMMEEMKKLQELAQSGQYKQDSAEFKKIEQQLITRKGELESFRQVQQREFLRRESEIYKTVYLDVQDMVRMYAEKFDYTLIVRFNRSKVDEAENPQEVIQSMNRQVVYHRGQDDITPRILQALNQQYSRAQQGG